MCHIIYSSWFSYQLYHNRIATPFKDPEIFQSKESITSVPADAQELVKTSTHLFDYESICFLPKEVEKISISKETSPNTIYISISNIRTRINNCFKYSKYGLIHIKLLDSSRN